MKQKVFNISLTLLLILSFSILTVKCYSLNPTDFTITRITAPYFIVDGNQPNVYTRAYVGFEITNKQSSSITYNQLKFSITSISSSITGQNYSIISPASGIINVGTLAPGQSKVCYYYVSYPTAAGNQPQAVATFNLKLSDETLSSKTQSESIFNRSSISANAGGLTRASINNQDLLGGYISDTITYTVGNVRNGDENDFQVAITPDFDPTKLTLISTKIISSTVPQINAGTTDSLYFVSGNGSTGASVTVLWKFKITGYGFSSSLLPCAGATSGNTNYKYALNSDLGAGVPITVSANANQLSISKTSDKPVYCFDRDSYAVFTITINNPGAYPVSLDKIVDTLPNGFLYQSLEPSSSVNTSNSVSVPTLGASGTIVFEGGVNNGSTSSYEVPAGGSISLIYKATVPNTTSNNLASGSGAFVGITSIGSSSINISTSCNQSPTAVDDNFTTNENESINGNVSLNDSPSGDGNNSWSLISVTSNGILVFNNDGSFSYTPNAFFNGNDTFYYKICDVNSDCDTAMAVITVLSVNDLPIAYDNSNSTITNTPVNGNVSNNDSPSGDGGNTWSVVSDPSHGVLNFNSDGTYTYTPENNFNGIDTFYYRLCDVDEDCDTAMVVITVSNPLALSILDFNATKLNTLSNLISWSFVSPKNLTYVELEKSYNGINFNTLATKLNSGFTKYEHVDNLDKFHEVSYYRLKMFENNGSFSYSKTIVLYSKADNRAFTVYPNPTNNNFNISLYSNKFDNIQILLYDNDGKIIARKKSTLVKGQNLINVDEISKCPNGNYWIEVITSDQKSIQKIVKQ